MTNKKISVVTVCYNSFDMLKETMQNVDKQTYDNFEYIVVDGNSSDGTVDYLKNYNGKLTKYISEPDKGIYDAMNKGVKISSGDYVIFSNAGDIFAEKEHDNFFNKIRLLPRLYYVYWYTKIRGK